MLRSAGDLASLALEGIGVTVVPRPVAEAIVTADHADCVLTLDDPQALLPLALAHRDPAPTSPAAQAFLRLALARLPAETAVGADTPTMSGWSWNHARTAASREAAVRWRRGQECGLPGELLERRLFGFHPEAGGDSEPDDQDGCEEAEDHRDAVVD